MRKIILTILVVLAGAYPAQADTVWLSGHHEIVDGDVYGEIYMYNDATATMFGGDVYKLETYDYSTFDVIDGIMGLLYVHENSTVNIHGCDLYALGATGVALVNLYAYDVIYHPTGGHFDRGWIEGKYVVDDIPFSFDLNHLDTFSHINVIPEPVDAEIDIKPETLNLASKGKWISCKIWLPEGYNVNDIDPDTILIERRFKAEWKWFNEEQQVVMIKFKRSKLDTILEPGDIGLTVTCQLLDGTYFEGTDTIKVIDKGRLRRSRVNSNSKVVDGIEYYIQTDKAVYNLGENVEMLYRVTNLRDEDVTFGYFALPVWNFWVEKGREIIWQAVNIWYGVRIKFTLNPGESKEFPNHDDPWMWNMQDREGNPVSPGKYSVIGGLYNGSGSYDYTKVTVPIRIVPEPAHASPKNK